MNMLQYGVVVSSEESLKTKNRVVKNACAFYLQPRSQVLREDISQTRMPRVAASLVTYNLAGYHQLR